MLVGEIVLLLLMVLVLVLRESGSFVLSLGAYCFVLLLMLRQVREIMMHLLCRRRGVMMYLL